LLNDKQSSTHACWRNGIFANQIVNIQHCPRMQNGAADGFSCQYTDALTRPGDSAEWTVSADWETAAGLVNNVMRITPSSVTGLQTRFQDKPLLLHVVEALAEVDNGTDERAKKQAQKRAVGYMIEDGKLWKVAGGPPTRACARVECMTKEEAVELDKKEHKDGGHWGCNVVKLQLMDRIYSPGLDKLVVKAIQECAQCKNYRAAHLHALLNPIVCQHLFELIVGDYLSMPLGKGGFHTVALFLDTCTQFVWGFKFKTHGTGKTTVDSLNKIRTAFTIFKTFQSNSSQHFNCQEVRNWCTENKSQHHVVAAYSPWVNSLVKNANKLFLGRVTRPLSSPYLFAF
jgi:hypothetical protein